MRAHFVSSTVLRAYIFLLTPKSNYYPHFASEETKAPSG